MRTLATQQPMVAPEHWEVDGKVWMNDESLPGLYRVNIKTGHWRRWLPYGVMKGGGVLEMSEVLWFSPKGRKLEGTGIIPDKIVVPSVADLQRRRDPVLAEADKSLVKTAVLESKEAGSWDGKSVPR